MRCRRCIYNQTIPHIAFDASGVCNYCHQHDKLNEQYPTGKRGQKVLEDIVAKIKKAGRRKKYDVVVGVSGGCDSSYTLYLAKKMGLRPLAAHFDNTWNSQIAVENIQNMLTALDVDLFTYVVDREEYTDIFKAFFKASVPEVDTPTDIALATTHFIAAKKYNIRYIWHGHSFRTEGISPLGWFYMDAKYIADVHRKFGTRSMGNFPNLWMKDWMRWIILDRIKQIRPLYYIDYNKEDIKSFLSKHFGWQWYGGHHMENHTSYFTNNYYLPKKFGIDPRYTELSALVRSGQMRRADAMAEISKAKQIDPNIIAEVKTRLQLSNDDFENIMNAPNKSFRDYKTYKKMFERMRVLFWLLAKLKLVPESFYRKYTAKEHSI